MMELEKLVNISRKYAVKSSIILITHKEVKSGQVTIKNLQERHKLTHSKAYALYRSLKKF
ncbi:hypothetical protein GCM10026988_17140 [Vibrio panuliri]|uniref:Uncharacterized protein n=1 Tax=Vibrio panuliri TaxID=1381081 RepID=A0ABX3F875_9VIBR|nr:hypothetical protein BIY20_17155 [Vibrio panuliri]